MSEQAPIEVRLARMESDIAFIKEEVATLSKHLVHGNGTRSVLDRLTTMETQRGNARYYITTGISLLAIVVAAFALLN